MQDRSRDSSPCSPTSSSASPSRSSSVRRSSFGSVKEDVEGMLPLHDETASYPIYVGKLLSCSIQLPMLTAGCCRNRPDVRRHPPATDVRGPDFGRHGCIRVAGSRILLSVRGVPRLEADSPGWQATEQELQ